ncbi:MAG: NADH-quinone oxidoreductase subunit M [Elusimicrobia bacterium]|nr:NADH-quinone oxidoreductase subunit M [Elusimicrobiota bacterium]
MEFPLLSLITFIPLAGALAVLCLPKDSRRAIEAAALAASAVSFALSVWLYFAFDRSTAAMQFVERHAWIAADAVKVDYYLGVDGLSAPLVILTTLMSLIALIASLGIKERFKEYCFWFLILEVGMLGVFESLDFFLFYVFWEITLVPMYFLIGIWGGPQKEYAAIKFFLYTLAGSVFMLLGILALYFKADPHTFDMLALMKIHGTLSFRFQVLAFLAFYFGFAIKVPAFPFHTWLPLAHVEAPTAISVILAAVLLKMGVYGILRVNYCMLPLGFEWFLPILVLIAVINIVYGALCAMAQNDMKKMVAYSSINHMGYCLLAIAGVSATGFSGAAFQMINHGIITGALFLLVGVVYDRAHTRDIGAFGGLAAKVPVFAGLMSLSCFASLGLPGMAGFISEFLCFLGAFPRWKIYTAVSVLGVIITAAFFLRMIEKVFLGPLNKRWADLPDMNTRELVSVVPLAILMVALGIWPKWALDMMNTTMVSLAGLFK